MEDRTRGPRHRQALDEVAEALGVQKRIMVTGDRLAVAQRVAAEMGCTEVKAQCLPGPEAAARGFDLKERGHRVAVVGDGVNDAPALAAGDLGIAMGAAGSDVAIHSASIALMNNDLRRLGFLIRLSRLTRGVVHRTWGSAFCLSWRALSSRAWATCDGPGGGTASGQLDGDRGSTVRDSCGSVKNWIRAGRRLGLIRMGSEPILPAVIRA